MIETSKRAILFNIVAVSNEILCVVNYMQIEGMVVFGEKFLRGELKNVIEW